MLRFLGFLCFASCGALGFACTTASGEPSPPAPAEPERPAPSAPPPADAAAGDAASVGPRDAAAPARVPILFVHGMNGSAADWAPMRDRFVADGWPEASLLARTFADPKLGCNTANAAAIAGWIEELRAATGAATVDLVSHSMGTLSSRWFLHELGGVAKVRRFVSLGGMHHGLSSPCLSPLEVCVWKELCATGNFVAKINEAPATPPPTRWWTIFSPDDGTVPAASSQLAGAVNVSIPGIPHAGAGGLQDATVVYDEVKAALTGP